MNGMHTSKNGQAMVEFLLGLVGIVILLLGLNQVAMIVYNDFNTITSAREEVADRLMNQSAGTTSVGSDVYNMSSVEEYMRPALNPDDLLVQELDRYPSERENQFNFLWENHNPLQEMTSSEKSSTIAVTSPLFQRVIGRSKVQINNAVYMPPWEDLLYE